VSPPGTALVQDDPPAPWWLHDGYRTSGQPNEAGAPLRRFDLLSLTPMRGFPNLAWRAGRSAVGSRRFTELKVLLVEDEPHVASSLRMGLRAEGFMVVDVATGTEGLWQATENRFDVIMLDIMLPELSGYQVLRQLRAREVWTPVLMLTAKDGEYDQADAFDLGADDYLVKPFSFVVLVARLRALVRRGAPERPVAMTAGDLSLDPARHIVERAGTPIDLSPREFGLLEYLMRNKDAVCTKVDILESVWDPHYDGPDNIVEVYVRYLRRKIDIPFGTNTIETIRGVGYRLESDFALSGS
jgi:two-component system OmpR family response regulator